MMNFKFYLIYKTHLEFTYNLTSGFWTPYFIQGSLSRLTVCCYLEFDLVWVD